MRQEGMSKADEHGEVDVLVVVVELANTRCNITNFPALQSVGILAL